MDTITIRKATLDEVATVQLIGRKTFIETFAQLNTEADMQKYLKENFSEEKVLAELCHPDAQFIIAWEGAVPIGYLKVNTGSAQTELQDKSALEIERIYVKRAYHGQRVGQLLYEKALAIAQGQGKSYIWLGVWEKNPKAIRFYEKNGFVAFDKHIFNLGEDQQTDILMKKLV